jgi:acyl-CoA thioester hydrolase
LNNQVEVRVRYAEADQMGVVYHSNYLIWCEIGRTELMRSLGVSYAELEKQGTRLAVSEASLRYHGSARYDDRIVVETRVAEIRSRTVTFVYLVSRRDADLARLVSARTSLIALDTAGRPRSLPRDLIDTFRNAMSDEN